MEMQLAVVQRILLRENYFFLINDYYKLLIYINGYREEMAYPRLIIFIKDF